MSISLACPGCGKSYAVNEAMAGKKAKCQKCGEIMLIPAADAPTLAELSDDPLHDPLAAPQGSLQPGPSFASQPTMYGSPSPSSGKNGVPTAVWIVAGVSGGILLLFVAFMFLSGSSSRYESRNNLKSIDLPATEQFATKAEESTTQTTKKATPKNEIEVDDSITWSVKPSPQPVAPEGLLEKPVSLADRPSEVFLTQPSTAQAIVAYDRYQKKEVLIQRLDLRTGKPIAEHTFAQYAKLLGISRDGTTFLMRPAKVYASQETLALWRWTDSGAEQIKQWTPYEDQSSKRVGWAIQVDVGRVLTYHSQDGAAVVWDVATGEQKYRIARKSTTPMMLSPDGKYIIGHAGLWLRFFQSSDGKHVGSLGPLSDDYLGVTSIAFSPDGKSIAAAMLVRTGTRPKVVIFNASDGSIKKTIDTAIAASHLQWAGDDYLLAGMHLISLKHEMTVWRYTPQPLKLPMDTRHWFTVSVRSENYLAAAKVPSPEVIEKIDAYVAANVPILQAGDSVSLQVTAKGKPPGGDLQQKMVEAFRGKLSAAGYKVTDDQPFRLVVNVEEKSTGRNIEYRALGGRGSNLQVPDKPIECKVAFVSSDNEEVRTTKTTARPSTISFNRGNDDLAQQILDSRWTKLDSWIENMGITKQVRKFSGTGKYGLSALRATGEEQILNVPQ